MKNIAILTFTVILSCFMINAHACDIEDGKIRAVSLKMLQQELAKCDAEESNCSESLLTLGGIKEVKGYIVDRENNDIVLIGCIDPALPSLYTQDFVIALRNAWMKYARLEGNTYYYSYPGCSIDPSQNVMQKLNDINIGNEGWEDKWNNICSTPQNVRVMGIPFDTHFAKVMVIADYDMKKLVDGTDNVEIKGLKSITEMTLDNKKQEMDKDRAVTAGLTMNRFWFYPGENIYQKDADIVLIKKCSVKLLTENEYSSSGAKDDILAKRFANDLTANYDRVAVKRPIYKELKNLYSLVAVAKLIKDEDLTDNEEMLDFFINDFYVPATKVERSLAGRSAVKKLEHKKELSNGYQIITIWLPSCGGVSIAIDSDKVQIEKTDDDSLLKVKDRVLNQRPKEKVYWDTE